MCVALNPVLISLDNVKSLFCTNFFGIKFAKAG